MSNEKEQVQTEVEEKPVTITMNDLLTALRAIEVAQKRGAYEIEEMQTVGALGTKLRTFLRQNSEKENKEQPTQEQEAKA
jgi:hypothetical protein